MGAATPHECSEAVSVLLLGAQLDSIRAYGTVMQMEFLKMPSPEKELPSEILVSVSGNVIVGDTSACQVENFFGWRAQALSATYQLIGRDVTAIDISETGILRIDLGDGNLVIKPDDECNFEEVWAVMSDSPNASADHRWYVALDDAGTLSLHLPGSVN